MAGDAAVVARAGGHEQAASPEGLAQKALESLRADFAYNLRLLAQRDGELRRYDTAWAQLSAQLEEARQEAGWWQRQALDEAARASLLAEQVAVLNLKPSVVHRETQTPFREVAVAAVQTNIEAGPRPSDEDDVHALRDANQRLRKTITAMREHMEAEAAVTAAAAAVPGRDNHTAILLRRCQRDNARLHAERDLLIDACNALRAAATAASAVAGTKGATPGHLYPSIDSAPLAAPLHAVANQDMATQTSLPAARAAARREVDAGAVAEEDTSVVQQLALHGSAARALPREPSVPASDKITPSQAAVAAALRRHRLRSATGAGRPALRVRNWALRDE